jgi:excisionase family DNA binding protein
MTVTSEAEVGQNRVVYTIDETAEILRVSRHSACEAVRQGTIPTIRIGRRILVPTAALERMLEQAIPAATTG